MDFLIAFIIFIVLMAVSLSIGISMIIPLACGFIIFTILSMRRGYRLKQIMTFAKESLSESFIVVGIMLLIGCLTGLWRESGTVAYFVTKGVEVIPSYLFILACFLLCSAMSYALGTSFGVAATAGIILMTIARAGNVNPVIAAGAIMSGIYVGDRGSPAASSGNLVSVLTHTDMRKNVRTMLKTSIVPFILCIVIYGVLSVKMPMQSVDTELLHLLSEEFNLGWVCLIPAILMIILPFCGLSIKLSMTVSLLASLADAMLLQHSSFLDCLKAMLLGYETKHAVLSSVLSGGGLISMLEVCGILLISCSYGKFFQETGMLDPLNERLVKMSDRIGRFPLMMLLGIVSCAMFCNQTIAAIMQNNLSEKLYQKDENEEKMIDMENSVIVIAGLVPWCLACSVPRTMLGMDVRGLLYSYYLWLVPLWWLICVIFRKKHGGKI